MVLFKSLVVDALVVSQKIGFSCYREERLIIWEINNFCFRLDTCTCTYSKEFLSEFYLINEKKGLYSAIKIEQNEQELGRAMFHLIMSAGTPSRIAKFHGTIWNTFL